MMGFFVSYASNPPVDRKCKPVAPAIPSKLTSRGNASYPRGQSVTPSTTIMIGDRTAADANGMMAGRWTDTVQTVWPTPPAAGFPSTTLAFQWPTAPVAISPNIMVSAHPGKVIAVFFDGHAEKIPNETVYPTGL